VVDKNSLTKKFQKEMNAGIASLVLLCEMEKSKEPMYGYQIAKQLEENNQDMPLMKQGALYPVLRSLEKSDLLDSEVEPSVSGPPRRYYTITDSGREILEIWTEIWIQTKTFVDHTLKGANHA
jgi:PadR family transcriptional regulator PadR